MADQRDKDIARAPTMLDPLTPLPPESVRTAEATPSEEGLIANEATLERIGTVIAGKYRLMDVLGSGGMGTVYSAEHIALPKRYALKLLRPDRVSNPSAVRRFRREAFEAAATKHPGIVEIIDCGQEEDGSVYSVMELLDGASLHQLLATGPLPVGRAVDIAIGALDALQAAHDRGLIHRDIKPENLFVMRDEQVKVLDFGIAKVGDDDARLTQDGHILGTPSYMSLEQLRASSEVDARTDVYSLGATLYEMLTGHAPVLGRTLHDVMAKIISDKVHRDPRDGRPAVPAVLAEVVKRSLGRYPEDRFASAREMHEALLALRPAIVDDSALDLPPSNRPSRSQEMPGPGSTASLTLAEDVSTAATISTTPSVPPPSSIRYDTTSDPPDAERSLPPSEIRSRRDATRMARMTRAAVVLATAMGLVWIWWLRDETETPTTASTTSAAPTTTEPATSTLQPPPVESAIPVPPEMVAFDAGEVLLGSTESDIERAIAACERAPYPRWLVKDQKPCQLLRGEHPQRRVAVAAFAIDRDEVTNERLAAWLNAQSGLTLEDVLDRGSRRARRIMRDGVPLLHIDDLLAGVALEAGRYVAVAGRERAPASYVTWHGAQSFCSALGRRLPTEAEWAFAASGPASAARRFPWGDAEPACSTHVFGREKDLACESQGVGPVPLDAATGDVTPEGVRGMGGSVREWVVDTYSGPYAACDAPCADHAAQESDAAGKHGGPLRVIRGGGWLDQPMMCRSARRGSDEQIWADPAIGFRCAKPR